MLFDYKHKHDISLPLKDERGASVNISYLLHHLCDEVMKNERKELFVLDGSLCVSPFCPRRLFNEPVSGALGSWS